MFYIYIHHVEKRILHFCELASGFFSHIGEEMKWYYTLVGPQVFFIYSHSWRKRMMLHTCESWSGLRLLATNVDFLFTKPKKEMILHIYRLASGLTLGEELQWYHTLGSLQVVFSIHVKEGKKWYYTLASPQVVLPHMLKL